MSSNDKTWVVAYTDESGVMLMTRVSGFDKPVKALTAGLRILKVLNEGEPLNDADEVEFVQEAFADICATVGVLEVLTNDPA